MTGTYRHERDKYECPKCGEKFRLRVNLRDHKCDITKILVKEMKERNKAPKPEVPITDKTEWSWI